VFYPRFRALYPLSRVLSLFPRSIPFPAFYPFSRVLSLFPRSIPFPAFYPFSRVLSLFLRFISFSTFYPLPVHETKMLHNTNFANDIFFPTFGFYHLQTIFPGLKAMFLHATVFSISTAGTGVQRLPSYPVDILTRIFSDAH
jgi:hypothetical protein